MKTAREWRQAILETSVEVVEVQGVTAWQCPFCGDSTDEYNFLEGPWPEMEDFGHSLRCLWKQAREEEDEVLRLEEAGVQI